VETNVPPTESDLSVAMLYDTVLPTLQEDNNFGRMLAAYGGIFAAGSLAWGCRRSRAPTG
jgi:drug/metabolite transporter superfamily protein YnfA